MAPLRLSATSTAIFPMYGPIPSMTLSHLYGPLPPLRPSILSKALCVSSTAPLTVPSTALCPLYGSLSSLQPSISSTAICPSLKPYSMSPLRLSVPLQGYSVPCMALCPLYGPRPPTHTVICPMQGPIPSMTLSHLFGPLPLLRSSIPSVALSPLQPSVLSTAL